MDLNRVQWLEDLHRRYYGTLLRLAKVRLREVGAPVEAADKIVHQAFILAVQQNIRHHASPAQWLIKVVSDLCMKRAEDTK